MITKIAAPLYITHTPSALRSPVTKKILIPAPASGVKKMTSETACGPSEAQAEEAIKMPVKTVVNLTFKDETDENTMERAKLGYAEALEVYSALADKAKFLRDMAAERSSDLQQPDKVIDGFAVTLEMINGLKRQKYAQLDQIRQICVEFHGGRYFFILSFFTSCKLS